MEPVTIGVGQSSAQDDAQAAEEAVAQIQLANPKVAFVFAARNRDHMVLSRALRERLPKGTKLVGASTGGELTNRGYSSGGVVVAALSGDIEVGVGIGRGLSSRAPSAGAEATEQAASELGQRLATLDTRTHVAVMLDDGYRMKKEEFLLGALEKNQGLVVVGGGAGDHQADQSKCSAVLYAGNEVFDDAVVAVMFATKLPWGALRAHAFLPTGKRVVITKVDSSGRRILELDEQPAAKRYAALVGVSPEDLAFDKFANWMSNAMALRVGREHFLRAVWSDGDALLGVNLVAEGQELDVVKQDDIVSTTRRFLTEDLPRRVPNPTAALFFDCQARRMLSAMSGKLEALSDTMKLAPPFAGLTVNLETYCGFQINSTLTSLVFGHVKR